MNGWIAVGLWWASNGSSPRVPPSFVDAACLEVIDLAVDSRTTFAIGIPFEHVAPTEDEPPGSRRFRFFALCRDLHPLETLPAWISWADVESAMAVDPTIERPSEVLETSAWADCARPIDADPLAISCEATASGVDWDAATSPLGTYVVWGYTYEPAIHLWTPRPGVVRVVETNDGDILDAGPSVAFSYPVTSVSATIDAGLLVHGCAAGDGALDLVLQWTTAADLAEGVETWREFWRTSTTTGTFAVPFDPPTELEYQAVFLRAEAIDDRRRSFIAYTREPIVFVPGCGAPRGGTQAWADACGVASEPQAGPAPEAAGECEPQPGEPGENSPDPTGSEPAEPAAGSCSVATRPAESPTHALVVVVAWVLVTVHARRKSDRP